MFVLLSHVIDPKDRAYPGEPVVSIEQDSQIGKDGKPFNSAMIRLPNHFATHMDAPHHFNPDGIDMVDLPESIYGYRGEEIFVLDLPDKGEGAVITEQDIAPYAQQLQGKRLLLLRTGFEKHKFTDPDLYENRGPSLHPSFCRWLIEHTDKLVCIGMDWLSIASPANDFGAEAHRWLLGNYQDRYIVGIEDMSLAPLGDKDIEVLTLGPLRVRGVDSAQVSVMALLAD
ncbi:MAG: cyclase family protein [Rothia sp. (in: high G+C Gram-positive bacteria)]|nr:cyclase family protein [Rothia sp. (in: high G+C Gram-positive bacteria)]